jgi:hypothetical protein
MQTHSHASTRALSSLSLSGLIASSFIDAARALGSALSAGSGGRRGGAERSQTGQGTEGAGQRDEGGAGRGEGQKESFGAALSHGYVHPGVGEALSHLANSGAHILYLTARPITLASRTRQFLRWV